MKFRKKMSRKSSKKNFSRGNGVRSQNMTSVMRGGFRL